MNKSIFGLIVGVLTLGWVGCDGGGDVVVRDAGGKSDAIGLANDAGRADGAGRDLVDAAIVGTADTGTAPEVAGDVAIAGKTDTATDGQSDTHRAASPDVGQDTIRDLAIEWARYEVPRDTPVDIAGPDVAPDAGLVDAMGARDSQDSSDQDAGDQPTVTLRKVSVYGNCMPIVSLDPIIALWTVDITGAQGSTAQLTQASLTVTGEITVDQILTVDNKTIPLVGGAGTADQRKRNNSSPYNTACGSLCGDARYQLDLTFTVDGRSFPVSKSAVFACYY